MAAKRASKAEVTSRVNTVFAWLLEGHPTRLIESNVVAQFKVGERQARNYIKRATALYKEIAATDALVELGRVLARNERLWREAWQGRKLGLCHQLNMDRAKLLGLYEPETIRLLTGTDAAEHEDDLCDLTDEELRRGVKGANGGGNGQHVGSVQ